jgi:flavin-binding protein dodecin
MPTFADFFAFADDTGWSAHLRSERLLSVLAGPASACENEALLRFVRGTSGIGLLRAQSGFERIRDSESHAQRPRLSAEVSSRPWRGSIVSLYRVTELIGTSTESWQDAAATAVKTASKRLRDLRVAEVVEQDLHIEAEGQITYRIKLRISFKYEENL